MLSVIVIAVVSL